MGHQLSRVVKGVVFVALLTGALVAAAGAGAPRALAATCPPPPSPQQPFVSWSDDADYVLTTGGSFESGSAPWKLGGGASIVGDNAPNPLDPAGDSRALYLPAGGSATSACVTAPHIVGIVRFFARNIASTGRLKVEILVKGGVYDAGTISAGSLWAPSPMLASNAPNYKGAVTYQVRLTAIGGDFTVDDLYFDPYASK